MGEAQAVTNGAVVLLTSLISTLQEDAGFQFIKVIEPVQYGLHERICASLYKTSISQ